jgi:hypothetical protein
MKNTNVLHKCSCIIKLAILTLEKPINFGREDTALAFITYFIE